MASFNLKKPLILIFNKKNLIPFIAIIIVAGSGIGIYLYSRVGIGFDLGLTNTKTENTAIEAERVIKQVGEIYLLPDEIPTLATVSDKNQLVDQIFFKNSENGDKVLIYKTAGIAILYRPSIGKIINVGPVNLKDDQAGGNTQKEEELSEVRVLILNGTTTVGLTKIAADALSDLKFVDVSDRLDAENKPYEESVVVYLNKEFKSQADIIASSLSAQVSNELPKGEESDDADVVIILGENFASE